MKVRSLMTRDVQSCWPSDPLSCVAGIMWDFDCGSVPVVDDTGRVLGMITDRDVCMAAYTKGRTLREISAQEAMSATIYCCHEDETVEAARQIMRERQLRRLPIVDERGRLVGILSVNDLVRSAAGSRAASERNELIKTLAAVGLARHKEEYV